VVGRPELILINRIKLKRQIRQEVNQAYIRELANSINKVGLMASVILVKDPDGMYRVIDGKCRVLAHHLLDRPSISALVLEGDPTDELLTQMSLIANIQRADLNAVDQAKAVKQLIDKGRTPFDVAEMLGKTPAWVTRNLSILALPPDQLLLVEKGKIPASTAYELAQVKDDAERAQLADRVVEGKLTRDDIANIRKTRHGTRHRTGENRKPRARRHDARPRKVPTFITLPLGEGCRFIFGGGSSVAAVVELLERLVSRAKAAAEMAQGNMEAFAAALRAVPTR
jgi:ParB family chromosome partitioning protein